MKNSNYKKSHLIKIYHVILVILFLSSCDSGLDRWYKTKRISNDSIEGFINEFGSPVDTIDLWDYSLNKETDIDKEFIFVDYFNPSFDSKDYNYNYERFYSKNFKSSREIFVKLFYTMEDVDGSSHSCKFRETGEHEHMEISLKDLSQNPDLINYRKVKCSGCKKLISLRLPLGSMVYFTSKRNWITSIFNKWTADKNEFIPWINNYSFPGSTNVDLRELKVGTRFVFNIEENINHPDGGIRKGDLVGYFDKEIIDDVFRGEKIGEKNVVRYDTKYLIKRESKELINSYLINSDWIYGDSDSPTAAIRFNDDNTFSYSMNKWSSRGKWGINFEGDVYLNKTWTSNGEGYNTIWLHLLSKSKLKINQSETVFNKY